MEYVSFYFTACFAKESEALQVVEFQDPGYEIQKKSRLLLVSVMKARCFYQIGIFDIF